MSKLYKTGTVARSVGIAAPLLRMWETRYEIVRPTRGTGGQRMYTDDDIAVLRAVTMLVSRGHSIGELATWPRKDLLAAASDHETLASDSAVSAGSGLGDSVIVALDHEGMVNAVSPSIEGLLGWPHGMLVGQPLWGLLVDVPPAFERLVVGKGAAADGTIFWVWMRTRNGGALPCRFACGQRRRTTEGTTLTLTINAMGGGAQGSLRPLIDHVAEAGLARFTGTPDQVLADYVTAAVEEHGAALARVWTYKPTDGTLHMVASAGLSRHVGTSQRSVIQLSSYRFKVGVVARTGIPYLHNGLESDRDFDRRWIKREKLESAAVVPLIRGGELYGVMAQFFQRRLGASDVGKIQSALALCEASLKSPARRGRSR